MLFLMKMFRFYPPYLGSGIRVKECNKDCSRLVVQMKMHFWNKNIAGTHFGGSLYSMTDPFYVLMLMKHLGPEYIVWDKSANIRYKKPALGTVFAHFELTPERISEIKNELEIKNVIEPRFTIVIVDKNGTIYVEIEKTLHIKRKKT